MLTRIVFCLKYSLVKKQLQCTFCFSLVRNNIWAYLRGWTICFLVRCRSVCCIVFDFILTGQLYPLMLNKYWIVNVFSIYECDSITNILIDYREADESRLREVCESFLGPPTGMAENTSSDSKNLAWDPSVLVRLLLPFFGTLYIPWMVEPAFCFIF